MFFHQNVTFFHREEYEKLLHLVDLRRQRIVLLIGPEDGGKTSLLQRLNVRDTSAPSQFFYVDLREENFLANDVRKVFEEHSTIRPTFILDDADLLRELSSWDLRELFNCFLYASNNYLLILSTSNPAFPAWLEEYVPDPQLATIGIGYLKKKDAKEFFYTLRPSDTTKDVPDMVVTAEDWERIYSVFGGCPTLLQNCFKSCLKGLPPASVVDSALTSATAELEATLAQYVNAAEIKRLLGLIVNDPQGAVPLNEVEELVFAGDKEACKRQLDAMVLAKMIHIRYAPVNLEYSDFSNVSTNTHFVMAKSPLQLAAMREIFKKIEEDIQPTCGCGLWSGFFRKRKVSTAK